MKFFKDKKKLILGIFIDLTIFIIGLGLFFFYFNNNTTEVSSSSNSLETNITENVLITELDGESSENNTVTEIVTDEKASDKELKEEKVNKKEEQKSTSPYYIKVNYKANVVTVYTKDKNGKYTVPYKAMVCSCGTYTPKSGTYKTSSKYRWGKLIHNVYGQYATRIVGSILFHSVPYSSNSADSLLYEEYDKLGTTASAGCIRLSVKDCKWIYDNCPRGTLVEFYKSSDPGPLGKPTAQKISSVEECRNWDPTDPAANSPWHTYNKKEEEKPSEDVSNNITNSINNNTITNNTIDNSTNENVNNTIDNNIVDNTVGNNITDNNTTNNNIENNITNENVNNSVVDNSTADNSTNIDNNITTNTNTNSNQNNNIVNNSTTGTDIENNTTNNSITNNTTNTNDISNTINNSVSNNNSNTEINNIIETEVNNSTYNNNDI